MFNPEKLLGGLIRSSTRGSRGGLGGLVSGGAALVVIGYLTFCGWLYPWPLDPSNP